MFPWRHNISQLICIWIIKHELKLIVTANYKVQTRFWFEELHETHSYLGLRDRISCVTILHLLVILVTISVILSASLLWSLDAKLTAVLAKLCIIAWCCVIPSSKPWNKKYKNVCGRNTGWVMYGYFKSMTRQDWKKLLQGIPTYCGNVTAIQLSVFNKNIQI